VNESTFPYRNILIACSVNTARSPMAEGWLRDYFTKKEMEISVFSGGIASNARDGMLISMDAKLAMEELGIKLSDTYLSIDLKKPENRKYIKKADLILTLTEKHKKEVSNFNEAHGKTILTIREYGGESGDIKDPSMKGVEGFRIARDEIIQNLVKGLNNYK
jgi:protein-tyrosine-phosphatase